MYQNLNNPYQQFNYWEELEKMWAGLSVEQQMFVSKQKAVIETRKEMLKPFVDYLFELYKESFVSVGNGIYKPLADKYINAVKDAINSYTPRTQELEKENQAMKQQIADLEKQMKAMQGRKNDTRAAE